MKYKDISLNQKYNSISNCGLGNSLCTLFGADLIENGEREFIDLINCAKRVDKVLIYCTLSLPEYVIQFGEGIHDELLKIAPLEINTVCDKCKKTYQNVYDIFAAKPTTRAELKSDLPTIFDTIAKVGKKCLIVMSGLPKLAEKLKNKPVEIVLATSGAAAINKTLTCLKSGNYDFIFVIDSDYDDCVRLNKPLSKASIKTVNTLLERFSLLNDAIDVYCKGNVLLGMISDKGCHPMLIGSSVKGDQISDLNVAQYFNIKEI